MTGEQLQRIEELASKLTPIKEIAALTSIPEDTLRLEMGNSSSEARKAYMRGKARTALELRERELELARIGSPLAVQMSAEYLKRMTTDEDF